MPAFAEKESLTASLSYLRHHAQVMNCNPCFDRVSIDTVLKMNENGENQELGCVGSSKTCPCDYVKNGEDCEFGIFERVK